MEVPSDLLTASVAEPVLEPNRDGLAWPVALSDRPQLRFFHVLSRLQSSVREVLVSIVAWMDPVCSPAHLAGHLAAPKAGNYE